MSDWKKIAPLEDIPRLGSRVVEVEDGSIAVFRTSDDQVFAVRDACPHKRGPLSQGIVAGHTVTCPLHNWKINLESGKALAPDEGCTNTYAAKVEDGMVYIQL
ncbi:nitrite reductase small subunit NirD [Thiolapillus sp.]